MMHLSDFKYPHLFRGYPPPNFKVVRNSARFCVLWPLKFLLGGHPKILDQHYKAWSRTEHRAKFHVDQPMHLGDLTLNKKIVAKHKQPRNSGQSPM